MNFNVMMIKLKQFNKVPFNISCMVRSYGTKSKDEVPTNPLRDVYSASLQKENGKIYDKKPFKILCEEGKIYHWCSCGQSKNQPFCDGTHNNNFMKIKLKPIKFTVTKTKDYWLCNCKQTSNKPFCDGTHKREDIQSMRLN